MAHRMVLEFICNFRNLLQCTIRDARMGGQIHLMKRTELVYILVVTLLAVGLVSATNPNIFGSQRPILYLYWLLRLFIECGLFVAFRSLLESNDAVRLKPVPLFITALLLSLVPYVLAMTTFDIVLGVPELGLDRQVFGEGSFLGAFLLEIIYLFDDHLFLCLMVSLPRLLSAQQGPSAFFDGMTAEHRTSVPTGGQDILPMLDPPLLGRPLRIEAQEHYVVIHATEENRMFLGRFSDVVQSLPDSLGLVVHRSHWVARQEVSEVFVEKRNTKLRLRNGDVVPVSRRYRRIVADAFKN